MNLPRAKKSFGQNFLVDENVVGRIVHALGPREDETLIEIGPGRGALTASLVGRTSRLVAVELDRQLVPVLRERFAGHDSFTLVEADALELDYCSIIAPAARARVVANLPYNISTAILQRLIEQRRCVSEMLLMLQREVVERITARPGSSERGFLSVLVEAYCTAEALFDVSPGAFRPVPKVWSTIVSLRVRPEAAEGIAGEKLIWRIVGAGFSQRRKTIHNNLRSAPEDLRLRVEAAGGANALLEAAGIEPQRRAETLALEEWTQLSLLLEEVSVDGLEPIP